jgi:AraC family transcriptional regulator
MKPTGSGEGLSIGAVLQTLPDKPVQTSRDRDWVGVTVDVHDPITDYGLRTPAHDHHLISYCLTGSARLIQRRAGITHEETFFPGTSLLMPAGYDSAWDGDAPHTARLRIPASLMTTAAEQIGTRIAPQFELRNVFFVRDPFTERVAMTLVAEIERPRHPAQALIADTMSCALAAHLLRSYNGFEMPEEYVVPALNTIELARISRYIEENIEGSISLADLAGIVNVSRFHFARLFKRSTGITAISFVERRRIARAQDLITNTDLPLAQVALMSGFSDQSHFTRRFSRVVGCTPAVFAKEKGRRRSTRSSF